ncbi:MAG: GtrA family protein [Bacteroidota bacterium]
MIKRIINNHFFRFLITGGINTAFGYAIFSGLTFVTKNAIISIVFANIIGVLFNFKTYGTFVFKSRNNSLIFRFFGVYVFITLLQISLLKLLSLAGISNPYIGGGILLIPMAATSFILMRKFVFHQSLIPTEMEDKKTESIEDI